jgi:formylglycine-generating enzyme
MSVLKRRAIIFAALSTLPPTQAPAQPAEAVRIGGFAMDRTEVTIGRFRSFAQAVKLTTAAQRDGGGFTFEAGWVRRRGWTFESPQGVAGADNEPAVHVTWSEASAYCAHIGGRLPSAAEWRLAAYSEARDQPTDGFVQGRTYPYPVGETPEGMNIDGRSHLPVATTKRGVNGLYDMGANVWEWTSDRRGDEALTIGGSWWYGAAQTRSAAAQWKSANFPALYIGFRCVRDGSG